VQLSIVIGMALVMSFVMKLLRQPLIIGYLVTGIILGPAVLDFVENGGAMAAFSHIGIALLLFIVGLGLKPKIVKEVGKVAILSGLAQILFTAVLGFFIAQLLGFNAVVSIYLGLAFSLSSTIIIFKLLYLKEDQDTLYGRITIGFLLIQDIVAILFFIVLSSTAQMGSGNYVSVLLGLFLKAILVIVALYLMMKYIAPKIDRIFAENTELLFIFSIGTCFVVSTIFYKLNFSLELGALIAGFMLSISPYQREIANRIQPLRDFFLIILFIAMGSNIVVNDLMGSWALVIVFSLFILIGNPLILIVVMRFLKYTFKTSVLAGLTVSQISEFSLIIIAMGVSLGHLPDSLLAPATMVGLVTIGFSTYFISYNNQIYEKVFKRFEKYFSDKNSIKDRKKIEEKYDVVLFGCHIMGTGLIKQLQKSRTSYIALDHDPVVIEQLSPVANCIFGSAEDTSLLDSLPLDKTKLIISTVPNLDLNLFILGYLKRKTKNSHFICVSNHFHDADKLYKRGATYVIMPPYLGRRFMVDLFKKNHLRINDYKKEQRKHKDDLNYLDELDRYF